VLIDRSHRPWFFFSLAALAVAGIGYAIYSSMSVRGPSGGSAVGLIYGSVGYALMLFAGLLGLRKKFPIMRVGRTTTWMRGHLWLGLLSFPLILFHAAFSLGAGALTRALMVLFIIVVLSGLLGAVLQHFLPRLMTERVQLETIYEQIDAVRVQLLEEAEKIVADLSSALEGDLSSIGEKQRAVAASAGTRGGLTFASGLGASDRTNDIVREFFRAEVRPFLLQTSSRPGPLADKDQASGMFGQLRVQTPRNLWPKLEDLENLCDEKRGLDRQRRMHHFLHGWLLVHIPLSYALLALGAIHAVFALRY
jgi:predicted cobalt transporter CbtA